MRTWILSTWVFLLANRCLPNNAIKSQKYTAGDNRRSGTVTFSDYVSRSENVSLSDVVMDSTSGNYNGSFRLSGYGRQFNVTFRRATLEEDMFADDAKVTLITSGTKKEMSLRKVRERFIDGYVVGKRNTSEVYGTLQGTIFEGHIKVDAEVYYLEGAIKYFPGASDSLMVMYRQRDVLVTAKSKNLTTQKLEGNKPIQKNGTGIVEDKNQHLRVRNCLVRVVLDQLFYLDLSNGSEKRAIEEAVYHIKMADAIFQATNFTGSRQDRVGVKISELVLMDRAESGAHIPANSSAARCPDEFLEKFSRLFNFDDVCLGILFTHRPIAGGTVMGHAYQATTDQDSQSGICGRRRSIGGSPTSLNTAFVTFMVMGDKGDYQTLPRGRSILAVAHQLGHSFGAYDDPRQNRSRTNRHQQFIMSKRIRTTVRMSFIKRRFSTHSINNIRKVLAVKSTCFRIGGA